jgi:putative acetyltransferase
MITTKKKFTIEKFQLDDLDQILQLFHDTVHAINIRHYTQEQVDAWAPPILDRERWVSRLSNTIMYIAKIGNTVVGFGNATSQGLIDHMYTHKNFQGQGIASALLSKLEQDLKALQVSEIKTEASITAKPFFERHGYSILKSQEKKHRSGVIFHNYIMQKKL